jgi:hypothetical protein
MHSLETTDIFLFRGPGKDGILPSYMHIRLNAPPQVRSDSCILALYPSFFLIRNTSMLAIAVVISLAVTLVCAVLHLLFFINQ